MLRFFFHLFDLCVPDTERPLSVVGQDLAALCGHQETAVLLLHLRRPVLITLPL